MRRKGDGTYFGPVQDDRVEGCRHSAEMVQEIAILYYSLDWTEL